MTHPRQSNADIASGHVERALVYAIHLQGEPSGEEAMRRVIAHGAAAIAAAILQVADEVREYR